MRNVTFVNFHCCWPAIGPMGKSQFQERGGGWETRFERITWIEADFRVMARHITPSPEPPPASLSGRHVTARRFRAGRQTSTPRVPRPHRRRLPRAKKAPTRTIQMLGQEDVPSKSGWPQPCDVCDAPVDSVIDDAGIDDESASIVIVGGGPHALAALAALHEGSLSFGQYASDSTFERKVGFGSLKKVGTGSCRLPTPSHAQQPTTSRLAAMLTGACVRASQCA